MTDRKEIEDKKKALTWVLNFIHSDLEELSGEEWENIKNHLFSLYVLGPSGFRMLQESKSTRDILNVYETLKDHFKAEEIMSEESFKRYVSSMFDLKMVKSVQNALRSLIIEAIKDKSDGIVIFKLPAVQPYLQRGAGKFGSTEHPISAKTEDYIILSVYTLFKGISFDSIKKCEECEHFFINTTQKRKIYCSPRCTWKALARKKREGLKAHPRKYKAYLKKQREIMRKKYVEKRRAELGKNVKIPRRPRKED